ncbi:dTMP kinase [Aureimonas flava]|uniref:Thymidylate kinase n=2 Tax=Aureimonas flava TaxID=2320271 RepID=A0A3A1WSY2_9HYPH|nr:dTMP kinase [Aureimonas flava]
MPRRGCFITFEGPDGSGKTTQIGRLAARLEARGVRVVKTREPGGSPGADAIRHIVLSGAAEGLGVETEALLFAAARYDHVRTVILPALRDGSFVLCDRFLDSTRAYQGSAPGLDRAFLDELEDATTIDAQPDLTLILDLPIDVSMRRLAERRNAEAADRFEKDGIDIHQARRQTFLDIAAREPDRCAVIEATGPLDEVSDRIERVVLDRCAAALSASTRIRDEASS